MKGWLVTMSENNVAKKLRLSYSRVSAYGAGNSKEYYLRYHCGVKGGTNVYMDTGTAFDCMVKDDLRMRFGWSGRGLGEMLGKVTVEGAVDLGAALWEGYRRSNLYATLVAEVERVLSNGGAAWVEDMSTGTVVPGVESGDRGMMVGDIDIKSGSEEIVTVALCGKADLLLWHPGVVGRAGDVMVLDWKCSKTVVGNCVNQWGDQLRTYDWMIRRAEGEMVVRNVVHQVWLGDGGVKVLGHPWSAREHDDSKLKERFLRCWRDEVSGEIHRRAEASWPGLRKGFSGDLGELLR